MGGYGEVSRTKTPEQYEAAYNWLSTKQAAKRIGMSAGFVLKMIHEGHLKPPGVLNVSRSVKKPYYRISPKAVDRFVQECEGLVGSGS